MLGEIIHICVKSAFILIFSIKILKIIYSFFLKNIIELKIIEITTGEQCVSACKQIKLQCEDLNVLGFDCEWVTCNGIRRPVALLQLATVHGHCYLFRLNKFLYIPYELQNILKDSNIIKVGISPLNDARHIEQDYNVKVISTLDLRYLYETDRGLASLAASEINVILDKSWQIACSDWERFKLTDLQKDYAAKDAWVALEIFRKWMSTKINESFSLLTTTKFKILQYRDLLNDKSKSEISRYLDVNFVKNLIPESFENSNKKKISTEYISNQNRKKDKSGYVTRKSPLYHNCFMHAPDGELLCSCDRRKAQWYVDRGIAEVLPGEPYSIKLLFEPAARAGTTNGGRFYQQLKQNCCVVCGALKSYLKHNVVPKEYRKHFPNVMKDHQSHDIVLMCIRCHQLADQHNDNLRQKLAKLCNAPIKASKITQVRAVQKVKNCAKALLTAGDVIPFEKKNHLENEIKLYFKVDKLNLSLLNEAANLNSKIINEYYESHGLKVVNYFKTQGGGLILLEILWREHFLNTMNPQYLPALWSVTHNHSRLAALAEKKQI